MEKNLSVQYANKIKFEGVEEFSSSIFSSIYQTVHSLTKEIISVNNNGKSDKEKQMDIFCNENQEYNIISFLGERGMGKSSVMLSFAYYLKNYRAVKSDEFYFEEMNNIDFYVLPKIDASMIMESESFFDFILAKMWDAFSEKTKDFTTEECFLSRTKIKFSKVRQSYADYGENSNEKLRNSQLTELHELSRTLNLKNGFSDLVQSFLNCMKKKSGDNLFLVILIDDVDMATHNLYNNLEQMRLFLMIPQVIILMTADMERLLLGVKAELSKQLLCNINVIERDKRILSEYAEKYLAKVLPRNMRIYMPSLNGIDGVKLTLDYKEYIENIFYRETDNKTNKKEEALKEIFDEKRYVLVVLAKYMNILMYPGEYSYSIKTKSLRNVVNYINELDKIIRKKDNYNLIHQWVQKEINISKFFIEDERHVEFLKRLMNVKEDILNHFLVNWQGEKENKINREPGYGEVLHRFKELENVWMHDSEFFRLLIWFYSISINKLIEEKNIKELEQAFVRKDIFSSILLGNKVEGYKNIAQLFNIEWLCDENKENAILKNMSNIISLFKMLLFTDMEEVLKEVKLHCNIIEGDVDLENGSLGEKRMQTYAELIYADIHIENYFRNIMIYDKLWEKYLPWICKNVIEGMKEEKNTNKKYFIRKIKLEKVCEDHIKIWKKWKKKYDINTIYDIIPIQNVSIMIEVIDRIYEENFYMDMNNYLVGVLKVMIEVFKETENYCCIGYMNNLKLKYSEKLTELYNIINLEDVDIEKRKVFITTAWDIQDYTVL